LYIICRNAVGTLHPTISKRCMAAQTKTTKTQAFTRTVFDSYEAFMVKEVRSRRFKHPEMMEILRVLHASMSDLLTIIQVGTSPEGRSINSLTLGRGEKKIFMWSQMHGDEPTATMGIFDMLSYIAHHRSTREVQTILSDTTVLIVPMLNPDGAERFQRRNAQGIDINRDASQLRTDEGKVLKQVRDAFSPHFGLNLHDQEPRYTVGSTGKVATIALLAPAIDREKSENAVRIRAKKIASQLVDILTPYIKGHISRYDDSFEPRAFGDNIQKWGTSTVLIESGGAKNDPEKMFIRRLNCVALLGFCYAVATDEYESADISRYEQLPDNTKNLYDVIIRDVTLVFRNGISPIVADVGINIEETVEGNSVRRRGKVVDIGDLSTYSSFATVDGRGKQLDGERMKLELYIDVEELTSELKENKG
jgi:Zinc carboxypeptidase